MRFLSDLFFWISNSVSKVFGWLWNHPSKIVKSIVLFSIIAMLASGIIGIIFSQEPSSFDIKENTAAYTSTQSQATGIHTTATTIKLMDTLLHKPGGYLSNDIFPPGIYLDNIPEWEFGVLVQIRDISRAMRNDFSRSQSQSVEDKDLIIAEPQFNFDSESWILPSTEGEYKTGLEAMNSYLLRLEKRDAQFYARADNLVSWLEQVEKRLGSLSSRLSDSVGQKRINIDYSATTAPAQETSTDAATPDTKTNLEYKTPRLQVDNVFYEARGTTWALVHLLKAVEIDFEDTLRKKSALTGLQEIIRDLEGTQQTVWSPVILNGNGMGLFANHSLVMASYISKANAAIIDLKDLLKDG